MYIFMSALSILLRSGDYAHAKVEHTFERKEYLNEPLIAVISFFYRRAPAAVATTFNKQVGWRPARPPTAQQWRT